MEKIKVSYFVERSRGGNVTATAEKSVELTVLDTVFNELKQSYANPESCKPLQTLTDALISIAKLQGYNFVSIMQIEDVELYEYD